MLNFAINNEAIQGDVPIPLLTNQPPFMEVVIMADANRSTTAKIVQANRRSINPGERFGRLTVIKEVDPYVSPKGEKSRRVSLQCDCGNSTKVVFCSLISGATRSCGCLHKEELSILRKTHGFSKSPSYIMWINMKGRCYNPNDIAYKDYGGRGISVCEAWQDYQTFHDWIMKNGWKDKRDVIIDRKNPDGNYEPSNVRFVNWVVNAQNTRLLRIDNTSGYRGVSRDKRSIKWTARIQHRGEAFILGHYLTATEAAHVYDDKVRELGSAHPLNFSTEVIK